MDCKEEKIKFKEGIFNISFILEEDIKKERNKNFKITQTQYLPTKSDLNDHPVNICPHNNLQTKHQVNLLLCYFLLQKFKLSENKSSNGRC